MRPRWLVKGYAYGVQTTSPGTQDVGYPLSFVWINVTTNVAYILNSVDSGIATWLVKVPDYIINEGDIGQINVIGESALGDVIKSPGITPIPVTGIFSDPGAGEYRVKFIRVDQNQQMVATFDETPE